MRSKDKFAVIVRYSEIFLKRKNRPLFEKRLFANILRAIKDIKDCKVERTHGRICIFTKNQTEVIERVQNIFGIANLSPGIICEDMDEACLCAIQLAKQALSTGTKTFKIETKRTNKGFYLNSFQVSSIIGEKVRRSTGLKVDLNNPDIKIGIDIGRRFFVFSERVPGPGGLPVGSGGDVIALISGGIDSPVAAWLCQKRGLKIKGAIHFYSPPYVGERTKDKVIRILQYLSVHQEKIDLYIVPFTNIQITLRNTMPEKYLVIYYRRIMLKIAERLARKIKARAIVTGDSLGQVASQTVENLDCISRGIELPIIRPLVTYDKIEIIELARKIGTYKVSIEPYEDCCSLFIPKHPETKGNFKKIEKLEEKLDINEMIRAALEKTEIIQVQ
jgi:thiamine biosynthesis protein ThiI